MATEYIPCPQCGNRDYKSTCRPVFNTGTCCGKSFRLPDVYFELEWFCKDTDELKGECELPGVTPDDVRRVFGLDDYQGECLEVTAAQLPWLESLQVPVDLSRYDYFVNWLSR